MVDIPIFIRNMGHKIISFILNISDSDALALLDGRYDLSNERVAVLNNFIQVCRQLRVQGIDQGDVDFSVFISLPKIMQGERHVFNIWHEQLGGETVKLEIYDPVILSASKIAMEMFPLFLIKIPSSSAFFMSQFSLLSGLALNLEEAKVFIKEIMSDSSFKKLFTDLGENYLDTHFYFNATTGRGGGMQLAVFPDLIIGNAFELMKLRGRISRQALLESLVETIGMLRNLAEGMRIEVPVFVGFHNVGFDDFSEMELQQGKVRAYNDEILSLIPSQARPSILGGEDKFLGVILECKLPYQIVLGRQEKSSVWAFELEQSRKEFELIQENLSFTLALAVDRTPAVGINHAWTLIFDPLCHGANISWSLSARSPMPYYLLKSNEVDAVKYWSNLINTKDDKKIRLAIRRILSSINDRLNPVDGFIDSIIAWENLFGGNAELSYRISISLAKLLKNNMEERLELQKKVVDYYSDRSKIVHGTSEVSRELAVQKRDACLRIALDAMKKLYEEHHDLLGDSDRSKKLALL